MDLSFGRVIRFSFLKLVRHVALGLDLLETNPAMSMLKTKRFQNWWITLERQELRKLSVLHTIVFPSLEAMEQQAFLRVIALSRRDQDRERVIVLLRLFALLHWP